MRCLNLKQALADAGLEKGSEAFEKLDKTRAGILIGSGMGGLTVFQDGVKNLVEKGYKKITPFFIPYAITNMCAVLKLIVLAMVSILYTDSLTADFSVRSRLIRISLWEPACWKQ